jgi:hypothetical protein
VEKGGIEEASENDKGSSHSACANGMNELDTNSLRTNNICLEQKRDKSQ